MLYPLSYEGLTCTFAQHAGQVSFRWARAGYLASDGLCRVPWGQLLPTAPTRGPIVRVAVPVIPAGTGVVDGNRIRMASLSDAGDASSVAPGSEVVRW